MTKINLFSIEQLVVAHLVNKSLIFYGTLKIHSCILDLQSDESSPETPFLQHNVNICARYKVFTAMLLKASVFWNVPRVK